MTSVKKPLQPGERSDRIKTVMSLSPREKRAWFNRIQAAQEAVEAAEENMDKVLASAYEAGMSYKNLAVAVGLHPTSVRDRILNILNARNK